MGKTASGLAVIVVLWIGYLIWPLHDAMQLVRAFDTRSVDGLRTHVNFAAVRTSLTHQIVEAYLKRAGVRVSPLMQGAAASAASSIAEPIVEKLISPEAFAAFMNGGWPVTVVPEKPASAIGITRQSVGTAWQLFAASDYGIGRFEVSAPLALEPGQRFVLAFRLRNWRWRLVAVTLPGPMQDLLADELIKMLKPPPVTP
jgi:hypothetical protein